MKKILIAGAGGSPATNFVRSLRDTGEDMFLVGTDCDTFTLQRAETNVRILVPPAADPQYVQVLNDVIEEHKIEFIHAQNDIELEVISAHREGIGAKLFLPSAKTVETCLNKFETYTKWKGAGVTVPQTRLLHAEADLKSSFTEFGPRLWLREIKGAAGKGSLSTSEYEEALNWIAVHNGWGRFTAAQCLTKDTVTWMSIWHNGALVVAQGRKRLSWELGDRSPSGVTGVTGVGVTCGGESLDAIATEAIYAIDARPHGIFSVDMTYDENGIPNPTEINIGRFFTTHYFFTKAGLNMPEIFIRLAYGAPLPPITKKYNPLPDNMAWIRGVDFLPMLTTLEKVGQSEKELAARLKKLDICE